MKNAIWLKRLFLVILSISVACILFAGVGCKEGAEVSAPSEIITGEGEVPTEEGEVSLEEGEPATQEAVAANISDITPADRASISMSDEIVVKFTATIGPGACSLSGTMANESDGGIWSATAAENDTLTISPQTNWPIGVGTLTIACTDKLGNSLPVSELTYAVQVFYVSENGVGDGTMDNSLGNINEAIDKAYSTWGKPSQVHVAEGTYNVQSGSTHIKLKEGISLYGGYSNTDWMKRDPSSHITKIKDTNTSGSVTASFMAVEAQSGITSATVIDGFFIEGGTVGHSSAIKSLYGDGPLISNNTLDGGKGETSSYAVRNYKSSPKIVKNTIYGGDSLSSSGGIHNATLSSPHIFNNVIKGGEKSDDSHGIVNYGSSPWIINNTISGGKGKNSSYAISNTNNSSPRIVNNIMFTQSLAGFRRCIYDSADSSPIELANNDILECPTALYFKAGKGSLNDINSVNSQIPNAQDNIIMNPEFVDYAGGNWHLKPGFAKEVREDAQVLSSLFKDDKDGRSRETPWSMGAYVPGSLKKFMKKAYIKISP